MWHFLAQVLEEFGGMLVIVFCLVLGGGLFVLFLSLIPFWYGNWTWYTSKTALIITGILVGIPSSFILIMSTFVSLKNLWRMNKRNTLIGVIVFVIAVWILIAWIT